MSIVLGCFQLSPQPCTVTSSEREDADIFRVFLYTLVTVSRGVFLVPWIVSKYTASAAASASCSSLEYNIFYVTWVLHESQKNDCKYHSISQSCGKMYLQMEINVNSAAQF